MMNDQAIKNLLISVSAISGAILMWGYAYLDGAYSPFGIMIEFYLTGPSEVIMLALSNISILMGGSIVFVFLMFYLIFLAGNSTKGKVLQLRMIALGICAVLLAVISLIPPVRDVLGIFADMITELLIVAIIIILVTVVVEGTDTSLERNRYANFLKTWFPVVCIIGATLFVQGFFRKSGQIRAEHTKINKLRMVLKHGNQLVPLDSSAYYIGQTKDYFFFYQEKGDSIVIYSPDEDLITKFKADQ